MHHEQRYCLAIGSWTVLSTAQKLEDVRSRMALKINITSNGSLLGVKCAAVSLEALVGTLLVQVCTVEGIWSALSCTSSSIG